MIMSTGINALASETNYQYEKFNTNVERYTENGSMKLWILPNFLPQDVAEEYFKTLELLWKNSSWLFTTNLAGTKLQNTKIRSNHNKKERLASALSAFERGMFAYAKYELEPNAPANFEMHRIFSDPHVLKSISRRLNEDIVGLTEGMFVASYIKDNFLNLHSDGSQGNFAFVLSMTKGWNQEDGGILRLFCHGTNRLPCEQLVPSFNTLIIFRVRPEELLHDVTFVTAPTKIRYSLTGWWYSSSSDFTEADLLTQRAQKGLSSLIDAEL